jgi:malate permease and related proteins
LGCRSIKARLGDTLAPLALVSVGLQLRFDQTRGLKTALATGLGFKLLLAPAVLAFFYFSILGTTEEVTRVTLFEAAMGPQIGGAIVAVQHGLNPPLVSLMVGVGVFLSFFTLPLWSYTLHHFLKTEMRPLPKPSSKVRPFGAICASRTVIMERSNEKC